MINTSIKNATYQKAILRNSFVFIFTEIASQLPSVGSCHHDMARPLGCGWVSRPPDMEVSCEYIE